MTRLGRILQAIADRFRALPAVRSECGTPPRGTPTNRPYTLFPCPRCEAVVTVLGIACPEIIECEHCGRRFVQDSSPPPVDRPSTRRLGFDAAGVWHAG